MSKTLVRVIPLLQINSRQLVKTVRFQKPRYIGDPINAIKLFNDKGVDELMIVDISRQNGLEPDFEFIQDLASECFMPVCYGGGLTTPSQVEKVFSSGIEKILIGSMAYMNNNFITELANSYGSQSIVASCDYKRKFLGQKRVFIEGGRKEVSDDPISYTKMLADQGAGEIILRSIDRDGEYIGFDLETLRQVSSNVSIPIVASCGAGSTSDLLDAIKLGGASAVAASSLFVFFGKHRGVLINIPDIEEVRNAV